MVTETLKSAPDRVVVATVVATGRPIWTVLDGAGRMRSWSPGHLPAGRGGLAPWHAIMASCRCLTHHDKALDQAPA